jgi:glycosyltransferase involved in cell wall biosynthesis
MKVSIITVAFNAVNTIGDTMRSVARQSYPDIEHIVIDGGSTDGTLDVIRENASRVAKLVSERDNGIYDALNKGISSATGDVIGILHSDDVFADEHVIAEYVTVFEKVKCDGVYADLEYVSREDLRKVIRRWKSGTYRHGLFRNGWMPPHPTLFLRSDVFKRFGTFNTTLRISADYELMLRFIHKNRISLCYLPKVTVKMRTGGASNQSLSHRWLANREDRMAWKLNGLKAGMFATILKPLRKLTQFLK